MVVYISCDIESDGPVPSPYSMLQIGAASFDEEGKLLSTFSSNLKELPGGKKCEKTMNWWRSQNGLYEKTRLNTIAPEEAMMKFCSWVKEQGNSPVFAAYPAAFDFSFVYWYLMTYVGSSPFSHSALDIKTLAMVAMKVDFRKATKKNMPKDWFCDVEHTHVAVEDAIGQGRLLFKIFDALSRQSKIS